MRKLSIRKKPLQYIIILVFSLILGSLGLAPQLHFKQSTTPSPAPSHTTPVPSTHSQTAVQTTRVTRIVDGDTIEIESGQKVRYIGIDTPELHHPTKGVQCYGQVASDKNKELVLNKTVRLEKDVSENDKYGRLLRYVYVIDPNNPQGATSGGMFVNEYLVKEGYAHAATFPPDVKYSEHFIQLERGAREQMKGLWKACPGNK
ncbi:thermonuclease family protein [Candidatus Roizmanbacteria bacterium]|nr:thermonuclease family protein [Candidatus Roizmanbacteria bacterium]